MAGDVEAECAVTGSQGGGGGCSGRVGGHAPDGTKRKPSVLELLCRNEAVQAVDCFYIGDDKEQVTLDAGVEGVGKAPLVVAAGIEDVGNDIGFGVLPTLVVVDKEQVVLGAGVEGAGIERLYVTAGVEDAGKGYGFGGGGAHDIALSCLALTSCAALPTPAELGDTIGGGGTVSGAQAESARAFGAPADPKLALARDRNAQCAT